MTPAERTNPKLIDGSRRARISRGSGTKVSDVNQLVDRFFEARKMMQQMAKGGGMPQMPGMPGQLGGGPGGGKRTKARQQPKKSKNKRRSGNPAKRAAQEKAAAQKRTQPQESGSQESPFGFPAEESGAGAQEDFELPKELRDLL